MIGSESSLETADLPAMLRLADKICWLGLYSLVALADVSGWVQNKSRGSMEPGKGSRTAQLPVRWYDGDGLEPTRSAHLSNAAPGQAVLAKDQTKHCVKAIWHPSVMLQGRYTTTKATPAKIRYRPTAIHQSALWSLARYFHRRS